MKKYLFILFTIILTACRGTEKENVLIVSVEPQRALLEEIVGDNFEVITMLTPGSNPETFEPGMTPRRKLETAKAYFTTGLLPFEKTLIDAVGNGIEIVDTSKDIVPVYGTHSHSHDHAGHKGHSHSHGGNDADPHIWTSVRNARQMATNMYDAVVMLDPDNAATYKARYDRLTARLDSLDNAFAQKLSAPEAQKNFVIWHPSLSYLARDYDLNQIAVGFENKEMPAATLSRIINEVREKNVKTFFFQKETDSRQAGTLNSEMGTTLVQIYPLDYDWESQLDTIVSALCR